MVINGDVNGDGTTDNGGWSPFRGQTELRIARNIGIVRGQSIELTADIFNVEKLPNHQWRGQYNLGTALQLVAVSGFAQSRKKLHLQI